MPVSRRKLIEGGLGIAGLSGLSGLSALGTLGLPETVLAQPRRRGAKEARAKNIIFCVTDGTAVSIVTMANEYLQRVHGKKAYWPTLMGEEYAVTGLQDTSSLNSLVTDSSAASSTWGSGRRIWNGQVNEYPDGTKLRPLQSLMREAGMKTGLVTTTTITHATPAGFTVNCVQRDLEALIAEGYLASETDVLMGGGNKFFAPDKRKDSRDLYADFQKKGYALVKNRTDLLALPATSKKVLGIFSDSHLPYSVDRNNSPELQASTPTLAEMTTAAISRLKDSPKGFLLQIEGGRVDHGGHSTDLAAAIYDYIAFEDAVKAAVDFAIADKNTLVVITADHATGGPSLNGAGDEYIESTAGLMRLSRMKGSYGEVLKRAGSTPTPASVRDAVQSVLGIVLSPAEAEAVVLAMAGKSPLALSEFLKTPNATLATMLGNYTKVGWTSGNHTSDHVLVTAIGPGSEWFNGLHENHTFFGHMLALKGIKFENPPQMDFETAKRHYEKLKLALRQDRDLWDQYGEPDVLHAPYLI